MQYWALGGVCEACLVAGGWAQRQVQPLQHLLHLVSV